MAGAAPKKWKLNLRSAIVKKMGTKQGGDEPGIKSTDSLPEHAVAEARSVAQRDPTHAMALVRKVHVDSTQGISVCSACALYELNLCATEMKKAQSVADLHPGVSCLTSTIHMVPARRKIFHPKEWSDFVLIICSGLATSSISLPDGRRQILSLLLPGDFVFSAGMFEPMSGHTVEAITDVTYQKFKRSEFTAILDKNSDLFGKLTKNWAEERARADQLALDLGRRTADERIAGLILSLAKRLAKCGMMRGLTIDFPLRQRQIADATGLTPVHVSKVLGKFQRARLIEISSRSLTIINETELRQVAGPQ